VDRIRATLRCGSSETFATLFCSPTVVICVACVESSDALVGGAPSAYSSPAEGVGFDSEIACGALENSEGIAYLYIYVALEASRKGPFEFLGISEGAGVS
jgi:hypothetical protein